jgi:WD40 repeat protein
MKSVPTNKSDVFSQQFLSENTLLSGSRDGNMRVFDMRAHPRDNVSAAKAPAVRMPSSVCWMQRLRTSDHDAVVASSMNGSIKVWVCVCGLII